MPLVEGCTIFFKLGGFVMVEENVQGGIFLDRNTLRSLLHNNRVLTLRRGGDTNLGRRESLREAGLVREFPFMTYARLCALEKG